ncbi:MAG: 3-phosphoserine/phosphohydroxythreonine transaminase [Saprospiraceae bacterium]
MKKHNFSPGPAILPKSVLEEAAQGILDFNGSGLSILEISHRSAAFTAVVEEAVALVKELLGIGEDYDVLFLTGGASMQFAMVPMNFLNEGETAAYINTGTWSDKAIKEAKLLGNVVVPASSKDQNYTFIPKNYEVPKDIAYLHLTSNNTIFGTQYHWWPETDAPIVADMSSDIFSRPLPMEKFGLIYAGAQKNTGPAGVTLVIIRKDMYDRVKRTLPSMLRYDTFAKENSLYNTPPVFAIYASMLTLRWVKANGGLEGMAKRNEEKAMLLYDEIDTNPFFTGTAALEDRSRMNVTFLTTEAAMEQPFLDACKKEGIVEIKGHRSVGGFRASIYNAMEKSSVQVLVDVMRDFAHSQG